MRTLGDLVSDASDDDDFDEGYGPQPTFGASLYFSHTNQGVAPGGVGRPRIFQTKEQLEKACQEYFTWNAENPLMETVASAGKDGWSKTQIPRMRAMTIMGLCLFLEISNDTWYAYKRGDHGQEFSDICTRVEAAIRNQKFEGAAGGFLNASIIARDLGLADKKEITGANGGSVKVDSHMTVKDASLAYEEALKEGEE